MNVLKIPGALIMAAIIIGASLAATWAQDAGLIGPGAERVPMIVIGIMLMLTGNYMPKMIDQNTCEPCAPSRKTQVLRFSGTVILLGGLGYALIWAFAPLEQAAGLSVAPVAIALALVAIRCAQSFIGKSAT